jgi:hypothetical protein
MKVTKDGFVEIEVNHRMIISAKENMDRITTDNIVNKRTFNPRNKIIGFVGEECFAALFPRAERRDTIDYDFLMDDKKIDVKTKFRSHRPKLHYNAAVPL